MSREFVYEISYGKARIPLYRVYASPLADVAKIPESSFTGRDNTLFAMEIDVEVFGNNFLPAYISGDNSTVVTTDTMKNFVLQQALEFEGSTLEGFLDQLGRQFLMTYSLMQRARLTSRELSFIAPRVPQEESGSFGASKVLFNRSHNDFSMAELEFAREGETVGITGHRCGQVGLQLLKVTGSSFTRFVHDRYTTLPERVDRPLFIYLDVYWNYTDVADMLATTPVHYIPAEQVRDVIEVVFHEFVSASIQQLIHEMGQRLLARFPQMAVVAFEAQNHTPDPLVISDADPRVKVYSEPFPAYGLIKLTMTRKT